jgi:transcriptional regulator with XRE-family HTH domain
MKNGKDGFPERLRKLRTERGLSQTELGERVELHYNHIGRYERGGARPTADALRRLADALGVTTDYLLEGESSEAAKARFSDRELLRQFQEVEQLDEQDKQVVKTLLEAFLLKRQFQKLAAR